MGSGLTSGECSELTTVNVSQEQVLDWIYTPTDSFLTAILIPIIWCLSMITNLTFLFVMFRVRTLRSDTNYYLAHLALTDLLYVSLASAVTLWRYAVSPVANHFPFVNSAQCYTFYTIVNTGYFASIALVTMLSFERYLAVCHPIKHLKIRGRRRTYRMVAFCWLLGLMFSASTSLRVTDLKVQCLNWPNSDEYSKHPSIRAYCGPVAPWLTNITQPLLNVPWLIAMVTNTYMYVQILKTLNQRNSQGCTVNNAHNTSQIRNQVARMLVVNGAVFFLCQTPYRIFSMADWICSLAEIPNPLLAALGKNSRWISSIPQYINGMINPLIYGAMSGMYCVVFKQIFPCKGRSTQRNASFLAVSVAKRKKIPQVATVTDGITETKL